ncbi:hypothetical protein [Agrilutibacter solisilvae]|uniref:Uncharacterized protein n=1 Tax=Agrilutibacter solisilvae TaxID=2763317 RepID=A0A974Y1V5_9GAMM|nr:hypothetical protein [Lysobacter solisilvae]QSX78870.1 hypothetical protein I8J32_002805 [Lysobacter solisilvae]
MAAGVDVNGVYRTGAARLLLLLLAVTGAGCMQSTPGAPCHSVTELMGQAATLAGQSVTVCGHVNGATRSQLVLTQAVEPPVSLRLAIDPAAAEQPDIAALLRAVDARTAAGGNGGIEARVTGVLAAADANGPSLKVVSVADVKTR